VLKREHFGSKTNRTIGGRHAAASLVDRRRCMGRSRLRASASEAMGPRTSARRLGLGNVLCGLGPRRPPVPRERQRPGFFDYSASASDDRKYWFGLALHCVLADEYGFC